MVHIVLKLMLNMICVCFSTYLLILYIINAIANVRGTVNVELEEVWTEVVGRSLPDVLVPAFA